jgi:hypothetical protein
MKRVKGVSWVFRSTNPSCFISLFSPTCVCVSYYSLSPVSYLVCNSNKVVLELFFGVREYTAAAQSVFQKGLWAHTHLCMREYYQISSHTCKSIHLYLAPFLIQHSQWGSPAFSICIVCVWLLLFFLPPSSSKKKNEVVQIVSQKRKTL